MAVAHNRVLATGNPTKHAEVVAIGKAAKVLGTHAGITGFTIGQRRGTGVAAGDRRYVVDIDAPRARVVLGTRTDLLRDRVAVTGWRATHDEVAVGTRVLLQTSAHGRPVGAVRGEDGFRLDEARPRVAPGQVVAAFLGDRVVGAGYAA